MHRGQVLQAPQLAYGRHRGPWSDHSRHAAVCFAVLTDADTGAEWIPLTVRSRKLKHHGGQISFPGGRLEVGESAADAALREFREELGPSTDFAPKCIGQLPPTYVYASDYVVTPVLIEARAPGEFRLDSSEVHRLIRFPLEHLFDDRHRTTRRLYRAIQTAERLESGFAWDAPGWLSEGGFIWGATALILEAMRKSDLAIGQSKVCQR
jgi:8-oxo-dGTP pyrophosphatase MutT (NUDIX family)